MDELWFHASILWRARPFVLASACSNKNYNHPFNNGIIHVSFWIFWLKSVRCNWTTPIINLAANTMSHWLPLCLKWYFTKYHSLAPRRESWHFRCWESCGSQQGDPLLHLQQHTRKSNVFWDKLILVYLVKGEARTTTTGRILYSFKSEGGCWGGEGEGGHLRPLL